MQSYVGCSIISMFLPYDAGVGFGVANFGDKIEKAVHPSVS